MEKMMDTVADLNRAEELLKPFGQVINWPSPDRLDVTVKPADLVESVSALRNERWGYLSAITGVDHPDEVETSAGNEQPQDEESNLANSPEPDGEVEILYHFCRGEAVVTLRTSVEYACAVIDSICGVVPAATLYERELREMFGVEIVGTPNTDHLLLPDDWPDGVYPLRKSFTNLKFEERKVCGR